MGLSHPVLIFPKLFGAELAEAVRAGFSFSVSSEDEIEEIAEIARGMARPARLHVKIDTGMGRFGIPHHEAVRRISHVFDTEGVEFEGIFTHFPVAEREDGFTENQVARFATVLQGLEKKGIFFRYRHGCNSAGCVKVRTPVFNMIRPGLMLYGVYPDLALRDLALIKPVLSLKTRILFVKKMLPGETAGYGRLYAPQRPVQLAVLGFGYSHGYPCQAFPKAQVLYKGHRLPLAGRISMDYATVELGSLDARVGDEVTLIGSENGSSLGAEEIAGWAGTIPYHIFTGLNARIPRFTEGHANG
jgi:alanine racemase